MRRNFYHECPWACWRQNDKTVIQRWKCSYPADEWCRFLPIAFFFSINSQSVAFVMLNHALKEILYSMCITFIALVQMYCDYIEYAAALWYWGSIRLQIHIRRCSQVNTIGMHIDNINGQSQKSNKGTCFHFSLSTLRSGALWPFCQKSNNSSLQIYENCLSINLF